MRGLLHWCHTHKTQEPRTDVCVDRLAIVVQFAIEVRPFDVYETVVLPVCYVHVACRLMPAISRRSHAQYCSECLKRWRRREIDLVASVEGSELTRDLSRPVVGIQVISLVHVCPSY